MTERAVRACAAALHHVADVTAGRVLFQVSGEKARDLIAQACSLDLHPRVFKPGECAQTVFAQVAVLIHQPDEISGFYLFADVSVADYLRRWFTDAAAASIEPGGNMSMPTASAKLS